jgi:hypothetical protein
MMQALGIFATSWPLAVMTVAAIGGAVTWSLVGRAMRNNREERIQRLRGDNAVVVHGRE